MATIKVIFRKSAKGSNEGTLFFRILHRRKMRQVHTGCRILKNEWNEKEGEIIFDNKDASRVEYLTTVRAHLKDGETRFIKIISNLDKSAKGYTVDEVVDLYQNPATVTGFLSFARNHINGMKKIGKTRRAEHYSTALNSLIRFNGSREIAFENLTVNLMQQYESYLSEAGICPNSISYYMRNLRALYNQAVEQGLTDQSYPFRKVYTGIAKTVKRAVALTTIRSMREIDLSHDRLTELARDLFLFSFCTRGMAIVDIAFLRKSNLKNGILIYRRQKTGQQLTIRWESQMEEICRRHFSKDTDFLFPLIDSAKDDYRKQFLNAYSKLIRRLKKIGRQLGLAEPLTFHRSRHSWASIARDHNVPLSVICQGMGHDSEKTTRIYLSSIDNSVVDDANSEIMRLLEV